MAWEDSCHGDSGDGEGGLFGRRAAASCGGLQARQPESASAVALSRADAAPIGGMDGQTLRDWVHRLNAAPKGSRTAGRTGRTSVTNEGHWYQQRFPGRLQRSEAEWKAIR